MAWEVGELQDMMLRLCSEPRTSPMFIFIDAVDECETLEESSDTSARSVIAFLVRLARTARDALCNLNICISCRHHLTITTRHCAEIAVDHGNHSDISCYVSLNLKTFWWRKVSSEDTEREIVARAAGIFLWAKLALMLMGEAVASGLQPAMSMLRDIPDEMEEIIRQLLGKISVKERLRALHLFQWVLFAQRPLSADEWFHVLAFVHDSKLTSIGKWKNSIYGLNSLQQLKTRVVSMTGGLLEVVSNQSTPCESAGNSVTALSISSANNSNDRSISGYAGSMRPGPETLEIRFIHESVHQYFLNGNGFKQRSVAGTPFRVEDGHMYILEICLAYTQLQEIGLLVRSMQPSMASSVAPDERAPRHVSSLNLASVSFVSFGSSAATSSRRPSNEAIAESARFSYSSLPINNPVESDTNPPQPLARLVEALSSTVSFKEVHNGRFQRLRNWIKGSASLAITRSRASLISEKAPSIPDSDVHPIEEHTTRMGIEEYAALRLYALDMFYHHAIAADASGADPAALLEMVEEERTLRASGSSWHKWCRLNAGVRSDSSPAYLAADWNLPSWIRWYSVHRPDLLNGAGGDLGFPLIAAWIRGHDSIVALILPHVDQNALDRKGWTVLHHLAARHGGEAVLLQLRDICAEDEPLLLRKSSKGQTVMNVLLQRMMSYLEPGLKDLGLESWDDPNEFLSRSKEHVDSVDEAGDDGMHTDVDEDAQQMMERTVTSRIQGMSLFEISKLLTDLQIPEQAVELLAEGVGESMFRKAVVFFFEYISDSFRDNLDAISGEGQPDQAALSSSPPRLKLPEM